MPKYRKSLSAVGPGEYEVTVIRAQNKMSKNGNEMIVLRLSVGIRDHWFLDHLVFNESSSWKIAQFLTAMGEEVPEEKDIDAADYVGRSARALVGLKEYEGELQNKIEKWLPPDEGPPATQPAAAPSNELPSLELTQEVE